MKISSQLKCFFKRDQFFLSFLSNTYRLLVAFFHKNTFQSFLVHSYESQVMI